jgi:hypothetical protein
MIKHALFFSILFFFDVFFYKYIFFAVIAKRSEIKVLFLSLFNDMTMLNYKLKLLD